MFLDSGRVEEGGKFELSPPKKRKKEKLIQVTAQIVAKQTWCFKPVSQDAGFTIKLRLSSAAKCLPCPIKNIMHLALTYPQACAMINVHYCYLRILKFPQESVHFLLHQDGTSCLNTRVHSVIRFQAEVQQTLLLKKNV